jgi:glutathione synthase/RimK-type ligase-like ATP-grasp enzyme
MHRIALATSAKYPALTQDDRLLLKPLAECGFTAEPAVWEDRTFDWSSCAAVVIRSCWDYHLKPEKFLRWIAGLEAAGVPVFNSAPLLRWNANKTYLKDLHDRGISIVPTLWTERGAPADLRKQLEHLGWHKAVIKPRISATAYRTQLVSAEQAASAQPLFDELRNGAGVMVQKFMDSIVREGEWSLLFFGGEFSHAVLKAPAAGDFRVQNDFGGTSRLSDPPARVLESAARIVHCVDPSVYARVDGVVEEGQFLLMELELIEPALFLELQSDAASRFSAAIARSVAGIRPPQSLATGR